MSSAATHGNAAPVCAAFAESSRAPGEASTSRSDDLCMEFALAVAVVALGFALVVALHAAQRVLLERGAAPAPSLLPPVSVLKPLCGADPRLEENLETIFRQDHPRYEVLLGAADAADPALAIARRVAARHPHVPSRVVADARSVGANPKVDNLAHLARHAQHEALLVNDSNVAAPSDHVRRMAEQLAQPGVGLVSAPFRGVSAESIGSVLEALQLNTFVMGGVAAMSELVGGVCVVGKALLVRRRDLESFGGFAFLGRHLAEDQVCGEEIARLGLRVVVVPQIVDNVLGALDVRAFAARHLRWARIRRWMVPAAYAGEILLNPVFLALVSALLLRSADALALLAAALVAKSAVDASMERALGVRRPLWAYPALVLAKDVIVGLAWVVPFFDRSVSWRGKRYRLGPRTLLERVADELPAPVPATA